MQSMRAVMWGFLGVRKKSGLQDELTILLKTKIYGGISAGSCVAGPTIYNSVQNLFGEKYELEIKDGLNLVDFQIVPHLNSLYFEKIRIENLAETSKELVEAVYAIDDNSAVVVNDNKVEVISEGVWKKFN